MTALKITVKKKSDELTLLKLKGEFEGLSALGQKGEFLSAVQNHAAGNLFLDLAEIDYIDSTAIGILLEMAAKAAERNIRFGIVHANNNIRKVLSVTKIDKTLTVLDS